MTNQPKPYELAQVNIARLKFPLDSTELKDFVDGLDPVNAVADAADGFVWRRKSESGNATDVPVFGDEWLILNALPRGRGRFLAHAARSLSERWSLTRSAPAGFRPARTSITRAEFLSLGDAAPHAVQV